MDSEPISNSVPPNLATCFYMDENVERDITDGLRVKGIDVLTVQEDGKEEIPDPEVMDRAMEMGRVVYTEDADLLREAHQRQARGIEFSGVIYLHKLDVNIGRCIAALDLIAQTTEMTDFANEVWWLKNYFDE